MSNTLDNTNISNNEYEQLISKSINTKKSKEKSIVEGKIISIENDVVIVDIGLKSEGRIPISEFSRSNQNLDVQVGDSIKVFIDRLDGINGEIKIVFLLFLIPKGAKLISLFLSNVETIVSKIISFLRNFKIRSF